MADRDFLISVVAVIFLFVLLIGVLRLPVEPSKAEYMIECVKHHTPAACDDGWRRVKQ